jgi:hypothetical protein
MKIAISGCARNVSTNQSQIMCASLHPVRG